MELSIIIPFYNEAQNLGLVLQKVKSALKDFESFEIIAVDDGSSDQSSEMAKIHLIESRDKLVKLDKNYGKGRAIREGIALAKGEWILIQDADLEYFPEDYSSLLEKRSVSNFIIGNRFTEINKKKFFYPIHFLANLLISFLVSMVTKTHVSDVECGLKLLKKEEIKKIKLERNDFGIEVEVVMKLLFNKVSFQEVPVHYEPRNYRQGKKIKFRDGLIALYLIVKYSLSY